MSQSPEGSTIDFHALWKAMMLSMGKSQSPEGSTIDFHQHLPAGRCGNDCLHVSQSPEGSTIDFHTSEALRRRILEELRCLNPPKGPPSISTVVISPTKADHKDDCLNPPKGPPSISTSRSWPRSSAKSQMSQSPEGSTIDFHWKSGLGTNFCELSVSIPRRVHHRFPLAALFYGWFFMVFYGYVSIPRRVHHRFPRGHIVQAAKESPPECLNPPKGPPSIST